MIKLSNGHELRYVAASGALGFDGRGWPWERPLVGLGLLRPELFTTFIKSLTLRPTEGNLGLTEDGDMRWWNFHRCIRFIRGGAVNRVGLTNGGLHWWLARVAPTVDWENQAIGSSMFGSHDEILEMHRQLDGSCPFVAHEVNVSCPNTGHKSEQTDQVVETFRALKRVSTAPLIAKLGVQQDVVAIARGLEGIVEAISLNTVPWEHLGPDVQHLSPLAGLEKKLGTPGKGGVSGIPAQQKNWAAVQAIRMQAHSVPVIGPSVMSYGDVARVRAAGARAISFGTCFMRTPWRPTGIVLRDIREGNDP